ncbi:MAG: class B sortase [Oscillospiraceae bacterium]|nr:class B sortase [Oscillospiraceae bacterium]
MPENAWQPGKTAPAGDLSSWGSRLSRRPAGHWSADHWPAGHWPPARWRVPLLAAILTAALLLSASGSYLLAYAWDGPRQLQKSAELSMAFHQSELQEELAAGNADSAAPDTTGPAAGSQPAEETNASAAPGSGGKFSKLRENNPDTLGWLSIPAVGVDGPVVAGQDNSYYLKHDFDRAPSRYGCLFLDKDQDPAGRNLTIYGHNLRSGAMFGRLRAFADPAFAKANRFFRFEPAGQENQRAGQPGGDRWEIVAVFLMDADPEDPQDFLEWRGQTLTDPEELPAFLAAVRVRSLAETGAQIVPGDRLLSLVTCAFDFQNARLVVLARQAPKD